MCRIGHFPRTPHEHADWNHGMRSRIHPNRDERFSVADQIGQIIAHLPTGTRDNTKSLVVRVSPASYARGAGNHAGYGSYDNGNTGILSAMVNYGFSFSVDDTNTTCLNKDVKVDFLLPTK